MAAPVVRRQNGSGNASPVFVKLKGEASLRTAPEVKRFLEELLVKGYSDLCVDMDELSFAGNRVFQSMAAIFSDIGQAARSLCIVCPDWRYQKIFRSMGLREMFRIFADPMEALSYLEGRVQRSASTRFAITWCNLSDGDPDTI